MSATEENSKTAKSFRDGIIDFTAGSLGGVALVYVGQPLDTLKVKMQTFPSLYKGMVNCFLTTLRSDGIVRGLYAGTIPALAANVAENSVLFAAYGGCQKVIARLLGLQRVEDLSSFGNAWAGFFAAFFSSLTLCPTELIKCKLQAMREVQTEKLAANNTMSHIGPWQLTRKILQAEGVKGLFTGLTSTIAREMPGYFFFFGAYEATREILAHPNQSRDNIGWQKTMIAGAVGGTVLWLVIFPADVVKSRIQVQNLKTPAFVVLKDIVRREGFITLYSGLYSLATSTFSNAYGIDAHTFWDCVLCRRKILFKKFVFPNGVNRFQSVCFIIMGIYPSRVSCLIFPAFIPLGASIPFMS